METVTAGSLKLPRGMARLSDLVAPAWSRLKDRYLLGFSLQTNVASGITDLDEKLDGGFRRGNFTALGAASGHGKTTLALQFARKAANDDDDAVVVFVSPEMRDDDIAEMEVIANLGVSRHGLANEPGLLANDAMRRMGTSSTPDNLLLVTLPRIEDGGLDELEGQLGMLHSTLPIRMIALDYAQYVVGEIDTGKKQRFALAGDVVKVCNRMAESYKCAVLLTSQVNVTWEKGKLTNISLRESALFEHSAAAVLYFVREFDDTGKESAAYFRIGKNRYGSLGKIEVETRAGCYAVRAKQVVF